VFYDVFLRFDLCTSSVTLSLISPVDDDLGCVGFVTLSTVDLAADSPSELKLGNDLCLAPDASAVLSKGVDSDRPTHFSRFGEPMFLESINDPV
jgi:hypothetical protein